MGVAVIVIVLVVRNKMSIVAISEAFVVAGCAGNDGVVTGVKAIVVCITVVVFNIVVVNVCGIFVNICFGVVVACYWRRIISRSASIWIGVCVFGRFVV